MVEFTPFQQSSLFNTIAGGGGTPLGAVPMDLPKPTPYVWDKDPTVPEPDTPEGDFDMGIFCSNPANLNHPMCSNKQEDSDYEKRMEEENKRDYFGIDAMKNLDDESLINYLKDGYIGNSKLGFLPSKGDLVTVKKPMVTSPLMALLSGKQSKMRRDFMIEELTKRGFLQSKDKDGNPTFNINPQLYKKNLDKAVNQMIYRRDNENDRIPIIKSDGTLSFQPVDRTSGKYYQQTRPNMGDVAGSNLTNNDGTRNENNYKEALRENVVNSVKNKTIGTNSYTLKDGSTKTNKVTAGRYSETLGGFTGGR